MRFFWQRQEWSTIDQFIKLNYHKTRPEIVEIAEGLSIFMLKDTVYRVNHLFLKPLEKELRNLKAKNKIAPVTKDYKNKLKTYTCYKHFVMVLEDTYKDPNLCCTTLFCSG